MVDANTKTQERFKKQEVKNSFEKLKQQREKNVIKVIFVRCESEKLMEFFSALN